MILILSNACREATLLTALCDHRKWPCQPCSTIGQLSTMIEQVAPRAVVLRHRLQEGYSDDVFALLTNNQGTTRTRVIVVMSADATAKAEARQIALGADCVLRDPVRIEVLMEYLAKYRATKDSPDDNYTNGPTSYKIDDVEVFPHEHRIAREDKSVHVAPQEIALLRLLTRSDGKVVTYNSIYDELLNRKFAGDTTNCRVLLGKVCASFKRLDVDLKRFVQVIPKSGYLYNPSSIRSASKPAKHDSKTKPRKS